MNRRLRLLFPCAFLATATVSGLTTAVAQPAAPTLTHTVLVSKLESPWDMAFLPDGTMFFTEKCHGLSVRLPAGGVVKLLGMSGTKGYAATAADLMCDGQSGMTGVAVDPNFATNRFIYVYSSSTLSKPISNRVMRLVVNAGLTAVSGRTDIVTDIAFKPGTTDHPFGGSGAHSGGRVRFNPGDGFLYVTTGDAHHGEVPQSPTRIGGKVLRIDRDGKAAPGNNAPAGFDSRTYTYGHRNPQGLCFRPGTNRPFTAEHGPWHTDEVTALVAGGNAGWDPRPNVGGRSACPDGYCGYEPKGKETGDRSTRSTYMPMTDLKSFPNAMRPAWTNDGLSQGMSSCIFLNGAQWKGWNGQMAVGFLGIGIFGTPAGRRIDLLDISADGASAKRTTLPLPMPDARFRSLVQGPDGSLYIAVDEGTISRMVPN